MSFREKSAWTMSGALLLSGAFYVWVVLRATIASGEIAPPFVGVIVVAVLLQIVVAIVGHALAAALRPPEAHAPSDERDRAINTRAGHVAGTVLGAGVVLSLGLYLVTEDAHALFHAVLASLLLAQLTEYGLQIRMFRTTV